MSVKHHKSIFIYEVVPENYLKRRQLKVGAGSLLLWGLGVGAVISGDFFGWNYGLLVGGFWGLAIATLLMAIMYICIIYAVAELSAALPHAGGFYSFTRNAFGPFWGYICGVAVAVEYVFATAAIASGMSNYLKPLISPVPSSFVWLLVYVIGVAICIHSMELSLYVSFWLTLAAIMVLGIFYVSMLGAGVFKLELLFNVPADLGRSPMWLPKGWQGVFAAIPYAIWFYLGIEALSLASEETDNVPKNMPRGLKSAMFTLIVLSVLTLVLNSGVGGGAAAIGQSNVPLSAGLEAYFGKGSTSNIITAIALSLGLGVSLLTLIYSYGRILFALSRAGYIPRWISVTNKNQSPYRALILGTVVGLICVMLVDLGSDAVDAVILNMSVLAALISYVLVMLSYIKLKFSSPELPRSYKSRLGRKGAAVGAILTIFALIACLSVPTYQSAILGVAVVMGLAVLYFFFSRNQLVAQAPEEIAAIKKTL
ncbi:amino acid permease [Fischerella sp. PCC 9605]|uniref:amino acid permease n=1 Tax=Fischerella sp. PCC 9605 TaxID=1173024 RepID=UPI0004B732BE|nr:amino acid permease [Fischerella sp. PCC 9605]